MKSKIVLLIFLCAVYGVAIAQTSNKKFNKTLADSLGADDYGMKMYVFVILKTGKSKLTDKAKIDTLFSGHMKNIGRLAQLGKLVVAGPMKKNDKTYRGIFILNVKTIEEANELLSTDPAIREQLLEPEIFQWYGSAALPMYLKYQSAVEKNKI
jgi:uncharacterized protein YciI